MFCLFSSPIRWIVEKWGPPQIKKRNIYIEIVLSLTASLYRTGKKSFVWAWEIQINSFFSQYVWSTIFKLHFLLNNFDLKGSCHNWFSKTSLEQTFWQYSLKLSFLAAICIIRRGWITLELHFLQILRAKKHINKDQTEEHYPREKFGNCQLVSIKNNTSELQLQPCVFYKNCITLPFIFLLISIIF